MSTSGSKSDGQAADPAEPVHGADGDDVNRRATPRRPSNNATGVDAITFVLFHEHPDYERHSHTFTVTLRDFITVSVADPHTDPYTDPDTGTRPEGSGAAARADQDTVTSAHQDTGSNPETYAKSNANADPDAVWTRCAEWTLQDPAPAPDPQAEAARAMNGAIHEAYEEHPGPPGGRKKRKKKT